MKNLLFDGYSNYTTSNDIHKCAVEECELGNVGTTISLSVTYSASVSWTVT
ncbi:signal protein [Staphylococcus agnetis]|uniref:signal protein n=1 Tax=Staphylococcus agnetis TaxID=985762 RepID=UPI000D1A1517|nr:signal protein [Staphylococcus agnetis]PTH42820.1 signal protein [Staphylococcus agnetis]